MYSSKEQMKGANLKGRVKEVDNKLYLISDDYRSIIDDYELAVKYEYIIIDKQIDPPYYIDELTDDNLAKSMTYIFCNENINNNIRVYFNSWDTFRKANKKLNCEIK